MKRAIIILALVAAVAAAAFFTRNKLSAADPTEKTQFKVSKAETGTVKKTVSATGTLQPWTFVDIKSKAGGRVDALLVDVGSEVKKGQILARIDPSDTQLQVDQAKADIDSGNARINQSQRTKDLQKKQSVLAVETARTSQAAAQANLDATRARLETARRQRDVQPELTRANIASAKANLDNAQKQLTEMQMATHPQEIASAQSAFDQAEANRRNAESNLKRQKNLMAQGFVSQQVVDSAQASYEVTKAQVANTQRKLDTLKSEQDASIAAMEARVKQAEAQYQNARATAVDVEIRKSSYTEALATVRQNVQQVENAKRSLELAQANLDNIGIRETEIAQAVAQRQRSVANLVNAQKTLDQTTVTAPTDGVVLKKYVEQGTIISSALSFAATGNNILQIGDVTRMYVDVTVDETDIANVDDGQAVDVTIESYPGTPFEGKVIRIDPQAEVVQNVTTIHVRVEVDNSANTFKLLKPGMNATCEFIVNKKENVVSVPTEAVRQDDKGRYVEIAAGGKPKPADPKNNTPADPTTLMDVKTTRRDVEVGLEGNEAVEVTKGLKEGEEIVTQRIEAVKQQAGGAFGGGMGMRGFGGGRGGGR